MTIITRERLLKIKQWRETYGAGHNVTLPAEEAEELARIVLASLDAKPVAWTDEQELRDVAKDGCGYLFTVNPITPNADPRRVIKLYSTPPAPVVPDGYCIMPVALTAKNGAKWALSGEFSTAREVTCPECEGDGCSDCDGRGDWYEDQSIDWTTIKEIYRRAVEVCALPTGQTQDKIA